MEKSRHRVFILDDDQRFLDETGNLLREAGFEVETCSRVTESLEAIRLYQPDCLLLDLNMPLFNGHDYLPWLRCQCPDLPIIVCTGIHEVHQQILSDHGVRQVLYKPFQHQELIAALSGASDAEGFEGRSEAA